MSKRKHSIDCTAGGRTKQSHKDECDLNLMVGRALRGGTLPLNATQPRYMDVSQAVGYHDAVNSVLALEEAFMAHSSAVRKRFEHSPLKMAEFLADEANRDEAIKLGLVVPPEAPEEPLAVRVVQDNDQAT